MKCIFASDFKGRELERLMHCRIATTSDITLLQNAISKPREQILRYTFNPGLAQVGAPLLCQLKQKYAKVKAFNKLFAFSDWARVELGNVPQVRDMFLC